MWISKKDYTDLVDRTARAESARDWALTQINILQTEIGNLRHQTTGEIQIIPKFKQESLKAPVPENYGEVSFDDMGDDEARLHGYRD